MNLRKPMAFKVILVPPTGAEIADLRAYVEDAVATWRGSYPPKNPLFDLDGDTVRATYQAPSVERLQTVKGLRAEIARLRIENGQLHRRLLDCQEQSGNEEEPEAERRYRS